MTKDEDHACGQCDDVGDCPAENENTCEWCSDCNEEEYICGFCGYEESMCDCDEDED